MYSGYSIPIKSSLSYIQCTFPGLSSQHVELCHKGLVECTLFLCINSWFLIKSIQKFAEVDRMLRLRNHFPLELCRKKKKNYIKIHTYRGKRVKHSELAWCQHYKKGWKKKKDQKILPLSLGANFCFIPSVKKNMPFSWQNNVCTMGQGCVTQGSNGKTCALQIIFER